MILYVVVSDLSVLYLTFFQNLRRNMEQVIEKIAYSTSSKGAKSALSVGTRALYAEVSE